MNWLLVFCSFWDITGLVMASSENILREQGIHLVYWKFLDTVTGDADNVINIKICWIMKKVICLKWVKKCSVALRTFSSLKCTLLRHKQSKGWIAFTLSTFRTFNQYAL